MAIKMTTKLFSELGISPEILKGIDRLGFEQASPIQADAIPVLMSGKDVVFLYLSNDDDEADRKWREYVQLNGITGEHVRMSNERIEKIWKELLPGEEARKYPTYFIFDRDGRVVVKEAKRPSDGEALYAQLSGLL